MECVESDCEEPATVELHIPWAENEFVCHGHARIRGRQEGVVADPLEDSDEAFPEGAANRTEKPTDG